MPLRNLIIGVTFTTVLLLGLGLTRLMQIELEEEKWELTKLETVSLTPPPAPPMEEVAEVVEELEAATPPPPAFEDLPSVMEVQTLAIPVAQVSVQLDQEVDLFSEEVVLAEIAPVVVVKPTSKAKLTKPSVGKTKPKPVTRSSISLGELDGKPRLIRTGKFRWPNSVRDEVVRATVYVELNAQGRIKLLSVKSLSAAKFRPTLRKFIRGCRFSAPKVNGKPVNNVRYNWPITLKKP